MVKDSNANNQSTQPLEREREREREREETKQKTIGAQKDIIVESRLNHSIGPLSPSRIERPR